jgi:hypothetical protein
VATAHTILASMGLGRSERAVQVDWGGLLVGQLPEPTPPPVTNIAWRLGHVGATCFANRASTFFNDGIVPEDADMFDPRHVPADLPGDAAQAVAFLERSYRRRHDGIASLDDDGGLGRPLGPKGGPYAEDPWPS